MQKADLVVLGAEQLIAMEPGLSLDCEGDPEAAEVGCIPGGALAIRDGLVEAVGTTEEIADSYEAPKTLDASGCTIAPGLVDPHTHSIFAGSRHVEHGMRMRGAGYLDILAAGGGIHSTVEATRRAGRDRLVREALPRLARALSFGVTTMEVKSGYGLSLEAEIEMLEAAREIGRSQPVRVVPTFLGAHVVPRDFADRREEYVEMVVREAIPEVVRRGLASACDVYIDEGAFSLDEATEILSAARAAGLAVKAHAGQFTDQGGPQLVASLGGLSADHLEKISDEGVRAMAEAGVVANLLPGAAFSLRDEFPDGRRLIDAGVRVALATDDNPGSSRTENLPLMAAMGAARMGLTCAEAWKGVTIEAARALGLADEIGSLAPGKRADVALLAVPDFRVFVYHFGVNHTVAAIAGGEIVAKIEDR